MTISKPINHVIFLGAGASVSSGYPLASELRLRLTSQNQMLSDLERLSESEGASIFATCFNSFHDSVELFRDGGFGSVDEFSKLASEKYPEHVLNMKCLTRLALSLHNPERSFHESDYYPFIQRLFKEDYLHSLKSHITVISYNYDGYLDYLLLKSQAIRNRLAEQPEPSVTLKNILTSGFFQPDDVSSLAELEHPNGQFRYFKLHGSIVLANESTHTELFGKSTWERFKPFSLNDYPKSTPPIVFPWELFGEDGKFIDPEQFVFSKGAKSFASDPRADFKKLQAKILHRLFDAIWAGAKEAVQRAQRVSFVGLSMHQYLAGGLKHLFANKTGEVELVFANKFGGQYRNSTNVAYLHSGTPSLRFVEICKPVAPHLRFKRSSSEIAIDMPGLVVSPGNPNLEMTFRDSFADFIQKEMD